MKSLVIAEKPSVGRDIARVLHCTTGINGGLEGKDYIVTWGLGHLVTLADPEGYDEKYKAWNMEDLPMIPSRFKLVVIKQTGKQFQAVKTQLHRKDVKEVIIATDAGREGELVARWILEKAGNDRPLKRLWISSVTDKAIREGFAHLKDGRAYNDLYAAAEARAEADWLVGINATRALTCKYNAQLSCGRVQTPTLAMIASREEEIRGFRPEDYYGLQLAAGGIKWQWRDKKSGSIRSFDKGRMDDIQKKIVGKPLKILHINRKAKKTYAPALYDLTELQREASLRFGYSAKETLNIMQRLYEHHKVLTYPRTDSRYLSSDVVETLPERLKACGTGPYRKLAGRLLHQPIKANSRFVDNSKVSDHHAIIPTEQYVSLEHLSIDERRIYDLVVRRFLAVLYPAAEYEQTDVQGECGGEMFIARGKVMRSEGWMEVYAREDDGQDSWDDAGKNDGDEKLKEQKLPVFNEGQLLDVISVKRTQGQTKPPAPFTEATLLSAMENPVRFLSGEDKNAAKVLGETGGLGTVATRADIIDKLFNSFLLEKRGKDIFLTSKGRQLLKLVPEDLKKPEMTADWELRLTKIAKGQQKKKNFIDNIEKYTKDLIEEIKGGEGQFRHDNMTRTKCPVCGKFMLSVKGKNSRMLVCQDRSCGHREVIARITNARCPKCHKRMELYGKGEDARFICSCGHKEKLSAFESRRKKEGAGVSKKDVQKYMQKQKKEAAAPLNNAFADAFARLNLDTGDKK